MASLALGAIGAIAGGFLGGPVGASIGWALGSALGSAIDPQQIQGPRLSDLKLQNSTYGGMIPLAFGAVRISGNVIWQTDLEEVEHTDGGKGGPEVTSYTYQASFAIRICEGPIVSIRRAWADSRLVYDATEGSSITSLPMTIYLGTETQTADPTMEAELGVGNVPGYRGVAYVVFSDLDLTEFANRIPSWTFEVMTTGSVDDELRIHQIVDDEPIRFRSGSYVGADRPIILDWPLSGTIRVASHVGTNVYTYNSTDLEYVDTESRSSLDNEPTAYYPLWTENNGGFNYLPCGRYLANGAYHPLWWYNGFNQVSASGLIPPIACYAVFVGSADLPETSINLPYVAGIPVGEWIGGLALSRDRKQLFLFTSPTTPSGGGNVINKWYKIVDFAIVAYGTVSPARPYSDIGFGSYYDDNINSFENNGRWMWHFKTSGGNYIGGSTNPGLGMNTYWIDDSGNFNYNVPGHSAGYTETTANGLNPKSAIVALQPGYCGAVFNSTLAIFTRFPANELLTVPLDELVGDLCERAGLNPSQYDVTSLANDRVDGYVIANQSAIRSAIEPLQLAYHFDAVESDGAVKFVKRNALPVATVDDDDIVGAFQIRRVQETDLPKSINVNYLNAEADYQTGTQLAQRQATLSEVERTIDVPVAMGDRQAKRIADGALFTAWWERERFTFSLPRKFEYLEPTDVIEARGRTLRLLQKKRSADRVIEVEAVKASATIMNSGGTVSTSLGYTPPVITPDQQSDLLLLDIPLLSDDGPEYGVYATTTPQLAPTPWGGVSIFKSSDGGVNYSSILDNQLRGTVGDCDTTLGTFLGGNAFDELNTLTVTMSAGSGALASVTELAVLGGANMALVGSEVLQFKTATLVSGSTYTLSGFLRGRRGTEQHIAAHASGETFVLLSTAFGLGLPNAEVGLARYYRAVPAGKPLAWSLPQLFTNTAQTKRQYTPVQLGGGRDAVGGNIFLTWVRRGRIGGSWVDYVDVPTPPEGEFYDVTIYASSSYATVKRTTIVASATTYTYTVAEQTTDFGSAQSTVYWTVGQRDYYGRSVAARGVT